MNTTHHPRLCVVGSSMHDQVTRAPRLPAPGQTLPASDYHTGFGGKGANQAVAAARLGAAVALVASLGRDAVGDATLQHYHTEGIETAHISQASNRASGIASIWVEESTGQNSILIAPGANLDLTPRLIEAATATIQSSAALLCQLETPLESCECAFRIARAVPTRPPLTILNPAPAQKLSQELLSLTDILIPNEHEAKVLTGMPVQTEAQAIDAARLLQSRGVRNVVITLGSQGAIALTQNKDPLRSSPPPVNAVDTTGSGDCFIAALAYFLSCQCPWQTALDRACAIAAYSVTRIGTQTSFPHRNQLNPAWFP